MSYKNNPQFISLFQFNPNQMYISIIIIGFKMSCLPALLDDNNNNNNLMIII